MSTSEWTADSKKGDRVHFTFRGTPVTGQLIRVKKDGTHTVKLDSEYEEVFDERLVDWKPKPKAFEANATYMVTATVHEPEGQRDFKERFGTLAKALDRALELRDTTTPAGGPGRRSVIFVDRQRRGNARDLHLALSATSRTWGIESSSLEAQEILGSEIHRQVGPSEEWSGPSLPQGFDGFDAEDVFKSNASKPSTEQIKVLQRLIETGARLERRPGGFWVTTGTREVPSVTGRDMYPEWSTTIQTVRALEKRGWLRRCNLDFEEWKDPRELTDEGRSFMGRPLCKLCGHGRWVYELRPGAYACQRHGYSAPMLVIGNETDEGVPRRYERNRSSIEAAREIRRKFHDKDPQQEKPVPWQWPSEMQEIGTCEAVMYASNKWQSNPNKIIDYKHVAEGPQRILVREGFVRDHRSSKPLRVVGPLHELNDMPDAFAVLDRILGVQVRMYEGTDERPRLPDGDDGYFQIDIPNAYLGAARHPETDQTFLVVYSNEGVHCVIVGDELNVEKDGIVG